VWFPIKPSWMPYWCRRSAKRNSASEPQSHNRDGRVGGTSDMTCGLRVEQETHTSGNAHGEARWSGVRNRASECGRHSRKSKQRTRTPFSAPQHAYTTEEGRQSLARRCTYGREQCGLPSRMRDAPTERSSAANCTTLRRKSCSKARRSDTIRPQVPFRLCQAKARESRSASTRQRSASRRAPQHVANGIPLPGGAMSRSRIDSCFRSSRESVRDSRGSLPHTWPALQPQEANPVDRAYELCLKKVRLARRGLRQSCVG